jgi:hypothetical protein
MWSFRGNQNQIAPDKTFLQTFDGLERPFIFAVKP